MTRMRVVIADDSLVVRRFLTEIIGSEPGFEVVGSAVNGREAVELVDRLQPDVLTLDVEMPEMDGLAALIEIRKRHKSLPVIMFSSLTRRGAATTLDALAAGATDYVTKPDATLGGSGDPRQLLREGLLPRLRVIAERRTSSPSAVPVVRKPGLGAIDLIAIGVSTGGPNALAGLLPALGNASGVPIVVVQHMPTLFTSMLADRLDRACEALQVREAFDGAKLEPGTVWIAPGDHHVVLAGNGHTLALDDGPAENSTRPSVDVLLRTVARDVGSRALVVILTGMGQDGLRGCEAVAAAGGTVFVQDEQSSVVWGMAGFVARAGLASAVLPLDRLASAILARVETRVSLREVTR